MLLDVVEAVGWASILPEVLTQRLVYVLDVASRVLMGLWEEFQTAVGSKDAPHVVFRTGLCF